MIRTGKGACAPRDRAPRRPRRLAATVAVVLAVAVTAAGCVGRTGRNDDDVAPGSGGGPSGHVVPRDD